MWRPGDPYICLPVGCWMLGTACDVCVCDFNSSMRRHVLCARYSECVPAALQSGQFERYLQRLLDMRSPDDRQASFALEVPESCHGACVACSATGACVEHVFAAREAVTFQYMEPRELAAAAAERREPGFRALHVSLQDTHYGHPDARGVFLSVTPGGSSHHVAVCRGCRAANARAAGVSAGEADAADVRRSALARRVLANLYRRGGLPHELYISTPLLPVFGADGACVWRRLPAGALYNRRLPEHTLQPEVHAEALRVLGRVLPGDVVALLARLLRAGARCNRLAFQRYCDTLSALCDGHDAVLRLTASSPACLCCGAATAERLARAHFVLAPTAVVAVEGFHARVGLCAPCAALPQADAARAALHRLWTRDNFPLSLSLALSRSPTAQTSIGVAF